MFCNEHNDDRATSTECTVTENFGKVEVIQHSSLGTETKGVERKQPPVVPMMHGKAWPDKPIPKEDGRGHIESELNSSSDEESDDTNSIIMFGINIKEDCCKLPGAASHDTFESITNYKKKIMTTGRAVFIRYVE